MSFGSLLTFPKNGGCKPMLLVYLRWIGNRFTLSALEHLQGGYSTCQTAYSKNEIVLGCHDSFHEKTQTAIMVEKLAIHGGTKAVKMELSKNSRLHPGWPIIGEEEMREVVDVMRRRRAPQTFRKVTQQADKLR